MNTQIAQPSAPSSAADTDDHLAPDATRLAKLLRCIGALVIISAAVMFLFQHWDNFDHTVRYLSFLGFTAILAGVGFFTGIRIKEAKGARTFLSIAAAVVPAHFAALGAMIYARVAPGVVEYPSILMWSAPANHSVALLTLVGLAFLAPIIYTAFSALVRPQAKKLCFAYLLGNSALLVPLRSPDEIALLAVTCATLAVYMELKHFHAKTEFDTLEGRIVRLMMFVPFTILVSRTGLLYGLTEIFDGAVFAAVSLIFFVLFPRLDARAQVVNTFQLLGVMMMVMSWFSFAQAIMQTEGFDRSLGLSVTGLPIAVMLLVTSVYSTALGKYLRKSASLVALCTVALELFIFGTPVSSLLSLVIGILAAAHGFMVKDKLVLISGLLAIILGLGSYLHLAMRLYQFSGWISLAIVGTLTVLASSYLERYYADIKTRMVMLREHLANWE